jgi:hypothetical protein
MYEVTAAVGTHLACPYIPHPRCSNRVGDFARITCIPRLQCPLNPTTHPVHIARIPRELQAQKIQPLSHTQLYRMPRLRQFSFQRPNHTNSFHYSTFVFVARTARESRNAGRRADRPSGRRSFLSIVTRQMKRGNASNFIARLLINSSPCEQDNLLRFSAACHNSPKHPLILRPNSKTLTRPSSTLILRTLNIDAKQSS